MNRYVLIRRLRGPAFLLLIGVIALLHQTGVVPHMWQLFWPLALILWGVLLLAERAAIEVGGYPQPFVENPYPGAPYQQPPQPGTPASGYPGYQGPYSAPQPGTAIVPANSDDLEPRNGGQA